MGSRLRPLLIVAVAMAVTAAVLLLVVKYLLMPMRFHPLPGAVAFPTTYYGALSCYSHFIIIPGSSIVVLRYHIHGNVTINGVVVDMAFPASIINETLTAFSKLSNPNDALIMGVYINGRLIASTNDPGPILGLEFVVSDNRNGRIAVGYTGDTVNLPTINLTPSDTLIIILYSAVPYALPSCLITNESSEAKLMVEMHGISAKLYEEGSYITEEPVIYIINATSPISQLPQELPQELLANARPLATGYAPSFIMGYVQLPRHVRIQVPSSG